MVRSLLMLALLGCGAEAPPISAAISPSVEHDVSRLKPCPESPNCVCSQGDPADAQHYIEALKAPSGDAMAALKTTVTAMPRVAVLEEGDGYLKTVFTSKIFRFKDDVEFELDADAGVIHVRSASRVGHDDLKANRKRVEAIRLALGG